MVLFVHRTTKAHISCVADVMWFRASESDFLNESTMKNSFKWNSYDQCWAVTSHCNLVTAIILLFAVTSSVSNY